MVKTAVKQVKIRLKKSLIGRKPKHIKTVNTLGLKKINSTVSHYLTPNIEGMISKVHYLLEVKEV